MVLLTTMALLPVLAVVQVWRGKGGAHLAAVAWFAATVSESPR